MSEPLLTSIELEILRQAEEEYPKGLRILDFLGRKWDVREGLMGRGALVKAYAEEPSWPPEWRITDTGREMLKAALAAIETEAGVAHGTSVGNTV